MRFNQQLGILDNFTNDKGKLLFNRMKNLN